MELDASHFLNLARQNVMRIADKRSRNRKPSDLSLRVGDAVVVPDGRIGMISDLPKTSATVQFGSGGPFVRYAQRSLRWARLSEVKESGLYGVGFNIREE
jgi:preprotein translocase subunit YajC